jgi:hypothetical protein
LEQYEILRSFLSFLPSACSKPLRETPRIGAPLANVKKVEREMGNQILLKEKHDSLEELLCRNLAKKRSVEVKIREQLEELKRLEISMEKSRAFSEISPRKLSC